MNQTAGPKLLDSCPVCATHDVKPSSAVATASGHHAAYRCPKCRHTWTCNWGAVTETPGPAEDPDAWEADDDFTDYDRDCWP